MLGIERECIQDDFARFAGFLQLAAELRTQLIGSRGRSNVTVGDVFEIGSGQLR